MEHLTRPAVGSHDPVIHVSRRVEQLGRRVRQACAQERAVERAKVADGLRDKAAHGVLVRNVGADGQGALGRVGHGGRERIGRCRQLCCVNIDQRHSGALGQEAPHGGQADVARGASDDGHVALEPSAERRGGTCVVHIMLLYVSREKEARCRRIYGVVRADSWPCTMQQQQHITLSML